MDKQTQDRILYTHIHPQTHKSKCSLCRISKVSYVVRVETFADRRHHVELPVLLVVPERMRHVVRIKSQNPEPGKQGAPAARRTPVARHVRYQRANAGRKTEKLRTMSRVADTEQHRSASDTWSESRKCIRLETNTKVPAWRLTAVPAGTHRKIS